MKQAGNVQKSGTASPAQGVEQGVEMIRKKPDIDRLLAGMADLETRLKAERVELVLQSMPGWELERGGRAITRLREFEDPESAGKFAAYLQEYAGSRNVVLSTLRWDSFVLVTLLGQRRQRTFDFVGADTLRFALSLG